jgi:Na+-transporting NADH:ubiquinone oxidoreductase subunit NqrB
MWVDGALQPRPFVLRTFALGTMRDCFVMPGGLGRVSPEKAGFLVTINAGAISKDVWVQADGEVDQKTLLGGHQEVLRIARPPGDVPSRIADHLFWLGRYAERLEQTSRVLRMLSQRLTGEGSEDQMREIAVGLRLAKEI